MWIFSHINLLVTGLHHPNMSSKLLPFKTLAQTLGCSWTNSHFSIARWEQTMIYQVLLIHLTSCFSGIIKHNFLSTLMEHWRQLQGTRSTRQKEEANCRANSLFSTVSHCNDSRSSVFIRRCKVDCVICCRQASLMRFSQISQKASAELAWYTSLRKKEIIREKTIIATCLTVPMLRNKGHLLIKPYKRNFMKELDVIPRFGFLVVCVHPSAS